VKYVKSQSQKLREIEETIEHNDEVLLEEASHRKK
jgi:hypothetical protein